MISRTIFAAPALILLSIFAANNSASAQNSYHRPIRHIEAVNSVADSSEFSHLQVVLAQPDKDVLKFRIAVNNPQGRSMSISINKGDDILFMDNVNDNQYSNILNLAQ